MISSKVPNIFLVAILMLVSLPAIASSGRIIMMSGDVSVNGQPMSKSHRVQSGDQITTGSSGRVNIIMPDKSVLDLQPNTKFKLERFSFNNKAPKKSRSIMNLLSGGFRYISGLVGRSSHDNATIRLGTATAGIRGSYAAFGFDGQNINVDVALGTMTMSFADGSTMTVNRGQTGSAKSNGSGQQVAAMNKGPVFGFVKMAAKDDGFLLQKLKSDSLKDAEKAFLITALIANTKQLGLSSEDVQRKIKLIVRSNPKLAPLIGTIVGALAKNKETAKPFIDAIKEVPNVDKVAVDNAVTEGQKITDGSDDDSVFIKSTRTSGSGIGGGDNSGAGDNTASGSSL